MSQNIKLTVALTENSLITGMKEAVARVVFDLVMIDNRLRQGDGHEVQAFIQDSDFNGGVGTIMITGNGDLETAAIAMRNGCHDFLAMQTAAGQHDLVAKGAHGQDVITQRLTAALLDVDAQNSVALVLCEGLREMVAAQKAVFGGQDTATLEP